ncbi:hypothetical protein CCACVL1_12930 [Corchorus capsularis]|uniref:Uncharacterized protein n=1 Tax=Corchorus capsularis TaxID=210143 RepID=A0A1R3ID63_COCAP|nr:hypothetical protein CCACVL1_12930 [Corchorus capsularis]
MGGGGVMRAAAKVAGVGVVNTTFRSGFQLAPPSAENSVMRVVSRPASSASAMVASSGGAETVVSANQRGSWDMIDDWEFAGAVEDEVTQVGSNSVSGGGEPMARVLFGGVPTMEEAKEATADLKDALDKVYLSSSNSAGAAQASRRTYLSYSEETKDCVTYEVRATSVPQPAIQAFRLLNESPDVQCVVASLAADPNVWNAVMNNAAYMDFVQSQKTAADVYEDHGSPRSSESSVKLEEYLDESQSKNIGDRFSDFIQNVKTGVVEMVNKATGFFQSLFASPTGENAKEKGSNYFEKTFGASMMGLAVMVIMVVILKRS